MPVLEVTSSDVCRGLHRTFPSGFRAFTASFGSLVRLTSAPLRVAPYGAIRRVMCSPGRSACRPWLLGPSYARGRVSPLLRWGDWRIPDGSGVTTFRIGQRHRARWPLDAGSWDPSQPARKHRLTTAPVRTCLLPSSRCASRRCTQGFTDVQLDSDVSWHGFRRWPPPVFLRLRPA